MAERCVVTPDDDLRAFLEDCQLSSPGELGTWTPLSGGVSSDIWHVALGSGDYCVKRALAQLKVAAEWRAPLDRNANEWKYLSLAAELVPGQVPQPIAHDSARGLFAMAWLAPDRHRLWKNELLSGQVDGDAAAMVGALLGKIHAATADDAQVARDFDTRRNFEALRIEPYLLATAERHPDLAAALRDVAERTLQVNRVLVHGDVSPKNILLGTEGPVLLDAECAWFGDPAFDLAFCLTHLILKTWAVPLAKSALADAYDRLVSAYVPHVRWEAVEQVCGRTAVLLPALTLARIDGNSPVEYLDSGQREAVRSYAKRVVAKPASSLAEVKHLLISV